MTQFFWLDSPYGYGVQKDTPNPVDFTFPFTVAPGFNILRFMLRVSVIGALYRLADNAVPVPATGFLSTVVDTGGTTGAKVVKYRNRAPLLYRLGWTVSAGAGGGAYWTLGTQNCVDLDMDLRASSPAENGTPLEVRVTHSITFFPSDPQIPTTYPALAVVGDLQWLQSRPF